MNKKYFICLIAALLIAAPLFAVFSEKNLGQTLHVLRFELQQDYEKMSGSEASLTDRHKKQHFDMVNTMKRCNELSLMLYSQKQDFTFDMTYALKSVTQEYKRFNDSKFPYEEILSRIDVEIERYSRLVTSLKRLPPQIYDIPDLPDSLEYRNDSIDRALPSVYSDKIVLSAVHDKEEDVLLEDDYGAHNHGDEHDLIFELDAQGQADRDSCIRYATELLIMYNTTRAHVEEDNEHYEDTSLRLKESYDYAQERYSMLQKRIFVRGQDNFFSLILNFRRSLNSALLDLSNKYGTRMDSIGVDSGWKGPKMLEFTLWSLLIIILSISVSVVLVRMASGRLSPEKRDYLVKGKVCATTALACAVYCVVLLVAMLVSGRGFFRMASSHLVMYAALTLVMLLSLMVRVRPDNTLRSMKLFLPMMMEAFAVMLFRLTFIPNSLLNLIFPPLLLVFFIWQLRANIRYQEYVQTSERIMAWGALFVGGAVLVLSVIGYSFIGIVTVLWWFFQISLVETLLAIGSGLSYYRKHRVEPRKAAYRSRMRYKSLADTKGATLSITWLYDFCSMTLIPVLAILSAPLCLQLALNVFDFKELCETMFMTPFLDVHNSGGDTILHLSVLKIIVTVSIYFIFKYLNYLAHAVYERARFTSYLNRSGLDYVHKNEINLSLGNSLISMLIWFIYLVIIIVLLKIPTGAVTVVATGLSAGIGLAMKDVLNNFIYGIQLMSGRLRVGDWVECDDVRGKVVAISYQSTQIETTDGAIISFLNMSLFNKNFKNLTRNNSYEFAKVVVGVSYGTDVNRVRELLEEAFLQIQTKDEHGREIVDKSRGVTIVVEDLGESSVDIAVKQYVLVAKKNAYLARAKELIYNTLNENGIEIPFPQRDVHIKNDTLTN